jgi:hypothetical protein
MTIPLEERLTFNLVRGLWSGILCKDLFKSKKLQIGDVRIIISILKEENLGFLKNLCDNYHIH